jgi:hypothetical protein
MSSEAYKSYQKLYYKRNKEARLKYFKACYRENKNKYLEYTKEYYRLHRDYYINYHKEYRRNHQDYWINYRDKIRGYRIINYDMKISVIKNPILDFDDEIFWGSNYKVIFECINKRIIQPMPLKYNEILEFDGELSSDEEEEQDQSEEKEQEQERNEEKEKVNKLLMARIARDRLQTYKR